MGENAVVPQEKIAGSALVTRGDTQAGATGEGTTVGTDEILIENSLSRYGLRTLHIMRMGGPVNLEKWFELAPVACRDTVAAYRNAEPELGVHHLYLYWSAREIVSFKYIDGQALPGVMWWIGKSWYDTSKTASIREAADWGSMTYEMAFGRPPTRCLVEKILEGWKMASGDSFEVEGDGHPVKLILTEELWVPKGFIVIT